MYSNIIEMLPHVVELLSLFLLAQSVTQSIEIDGTKPNYSEARSNLGSEATVLMEQVSDSVDGLGEADVFFPPTDR